MLLLLLSTLSPTSEVSANCESCVLFLASQAGSNLEGHCVNVWEVSHYRRPTLHSNVQILIDALIHLKGAVSFLPFKFSIQMTILQNQAI